jgi:hypothetical protein
MWSGIHACTRITSNKIHANIFDDALRRICARKLSGNPENFPFAPTARGRMLWICEEARRREQCVADFMVIPFAATCLTSGSAFVARGPPGRPVARSAPIDAMIL